MDKLAEETDGFTGADIMTLAEEATLLTIRETILEGKAGEDKPGTAISVRIGSKQVQGALKKVRGMSDREKKTYLSKPGAMQPKDSLYG